jgi:hypothetical protein
MLCYHPWGFLYYRTYDFEVLTPVVMKSSVFGDITACSQLMDLEEIEWGVVDWIGLAQDRDKWRALVNSVNLRVP